MKGIRYKGFLLLTITVMMVSLCAGMAYGAGQSSENYYMELDVFDGGGGWCTSASYGISHATGQSTPIGYSEGGSYRVYAGFFFPAIWYVPTITLPTQKRYNLCPGLLGFGPVATTGSRRMSFTIVNPHESGLEIYTIIGPSSPFTKTLDECNEAILAPRGRCTITVQFTPSSEGTVYDSLIIPTNDPQAGTVRVDLSGTGVSE